MYQFDSYPERPLCSLLRAYNRSPTWNSFQYTNTLFLKHKDIDNKYNRSGLVDKVNCVNCNSVIVIE